MAFPNCGPPDNHYTIQDGNNNLTTIYSALRWGPFRNGNNYYSVVATGSRTAGQARIRCYKSSNSGVTWSIQDANALPALSTDNPAKNIDCVMIGTNIHVVGTFGFGASAASINNRQFNTATDTWNTTNWADITDADTRVADLMYIEARSDGAVRVAYKTTDRIKGTNYEKVAKGGWTNTGTSISNNNNEIDGLEVNQKLRNFTIGASDRIHIFYDHNVAPLRHVSYNSAETKETLKQLTNVDVNQDHRANIITSGSQPVIVLNDVETLNNANLVYDTNNPTFIADIPIVGVNKPNQAVANQTIASGGLNYLLTWGSGQCSETGNNNILGLWASSGTTPFNFEYVKTVIVTGHPAPSQTHLVLPTHLMPLPNDRLAFVFLHHNTSTGFSNYAFVAIDINAASGGGPTPVDITYAIPIEYLNNVFGDSVTGIFSKLPGTAISTTGCGTVAWTTPTNVLLDDDIFSTCALTPGQISECLVAKNFNFSLPEYVQIKGIEVEVDKRGTATHRDNQIKLVFQDRETINKSESGSWPTVSTVIYHGHLNDLWNETQITPQDINSSEFGFKLAAASVDQTGTARLDYIRINIYYRNPFILPNEYLLNLDLASNVPTEHLLTESGIEVTATGNTPIEILQSIIDINSNPLEFLSSLNPSFLEPIEHKLRLTQSFSEPIESLSGILEHFEDVKNPTTAASETGCGNRVWNNVENVLIDDTSFAHANLTPGNPESECCVVRNFNFDLPLCSIVNGIKVKVKRKKGSGVGDLIDATAKLKLKERDSIGDRAIPFIWPTGEEQVVYGDVDDKWGEGSLSAALINDPDFGFYISVTASSGPAEAQIQHIDITVFYDDAICAPVEILGIPFLLKTYPVEFKNLLGFSQDIPSEFLLGLGQTYLTPSEYLLGFNQSNLTPEEYLLGLIQTQLTPEEYLLNLAETHSTPAANLLDVLSFNSTIKTANSAASETGCGTLSWSDPENILVDDLNSATVIIPLGFADESECLIARNFSFNIPECASINGVAVNVKRNKESGTGNCLDGTVRLKFADSFGIENKALPDLWGTGEQQITYGGIGDQWSETLTPSLVNNSGFGFSISVQPSGSPVTAAVQYIDMTVYYRNIDCFNIEHLSRLGLNSNVPVEHLLQSGVLEILSNIPIEYLSKIIDSSSLPSESLSGLISSKEFLNEILAGLNQQQILLEENLLGLADIHATPEEHLQGLTEVHSAPEEHLQGLTETHSAPEEYLVNLVDTHSAPEEHLLNLAETHSAPAEYLLNLTETHLAPAEYLLQTIIPKDIPAELIGQISPTLNLPEEILQIYCPTSNDNYLAALLQWNNWSITMMPAPGSDDNINSITQLAHLVPEDSVDCPIIKIPVEHLLGIGLDSSIPVEHLLGIGLDPSIPIEHLITESGLLQITSSVPIEYLLRLTQSFSSPTEHLLDLGLISNTPLENLSGFNIVQTIPEEHLSGLSPAQSTSVEFNLNLLQSQATPTEFLLSNQLANSIATEILGGQSLLRITPIEHLLRLGLQKEVPTEHLADLNLDTKIPAEYVSGLAQNISNPIEFLQGLGLDTSIPIETFVESGFSSVHFTPVEVLQSLTRTQTTPEEHLVKLTETYSTPEEHLLGLIQTYLTPDEHLLGLIQTHLTPEEHLRGLIETHTTPEEHLLDLTGLQTTPEESLLGLDRTHSTPVEHLLYLDLLKSIPEEIVGGVAQQVSSPVEHLGLLGLIYSVPEEHLVQILGSVKIPIESLSGILTDNHIPTELLAKLNLERKSPVEHLGITTNNYVYPVENLSGLDLSAGIPVEVLEQLGISASIPIEDLLSLNLSKNLPVEHLLKLGLAYVSPTEFLHGLGISSSTPLEHLLQESGVLVIDASCPLEILSKQILNRNLPLEYLLGLKQGYDVPLESLSGTQISNNILVEYLLEISNSYTSLTESLLKLDADNSVSVEHLLGLATTNTNRLEILAGLSPNFIEPIEHLLSLAQSQTTQIESILSLDKTHKLPVENLSGLLQSSSLLVENLSFLINSVEVPVEHSLNISISRITTIESLVGLGQTQSTYTEILASLGISETIPIEHLLSSGVLVISQSTPIEVLQNLISLHKAPEESLLNIFDVLVWPTENLSELTQTTSVDIENLETITPSHKTVSEILESINRSNAIPNEVLEGLRDTSTLSVEYLEKLKLTSSSPIFFIGQPTFTQQFPTESLLKTTFTFLVTTEFLEGLNFDADLLIDFLSKSTTRVAIPIEILGPELAVKVLKWVLSSRDFKWILVPKKTAFSLDQRESTWHLDSRSTDFNLPFRADIWLIIERG